MKKCMFLILVLVLLFTNTGVGASRDQILPNDLIAERPVIHFTVDSTYESYGKEVVNTVYTANVKGISDKSRIDFYVGDYSSIFPTKKIGSGYVINGQAVIKVFLEPSKHYISAAVYENELSPVFPPSRFYSNIVSHYSPLFNGEMGFGVSINNFSKTNVTYTFKFDMPPVLPKPSSIYGQPIPVTFVTYRLSDFEVTPVIKENDIKNLKPYRVDVGHIVDSVAQVRINLPLGRYIVYSHCEITNKYFLDIFTVTSPQIIEISSR